MADKKTRQMRAEAHRHFDPLWKSGGMTRTDAYKMLARHLGIPHEKCHISQMNVEQLQYVIEQCKGLTFDSTAKVVQRRKEKKDAKRSKRTEREKRNRYHNGKRIEGPNPFIRRARRSKQDRGTGLEGD
jgi:cobyrinic acid a,c-diamide synthase